MTTTNIILIFITGIIAGFLNTLGGGGSLLTLPMFIFLGLPAAVANGTNRIALTVQNAIAVLNFKRKGYFNLKLSLLLGIPAVIGSIVGAQLAINIPDEIFNKILAVVMLIVLVLIVRKPVKNKTEEEASDMDLASSRYVPAAITFFFIGIYGGFVQAGVGFIIIAALSVLSDMSLVKINSIKVFVVLFYMLSALFVFIWNGKIDWVLGLTLACGNGLGGWLGSSFAVAKGDKWIRPILITVVSIMSLKLLGFFSFLQHLI